MARTRGMLLLLLLAGCSGGSDSPSAPTPNDSPYRITISTSGAVTPAEIVVPPGSRVLFVNNHSRRHDMTSDPHPDHGDCPAINSVGLLQPGQSRETGNLVAARTCGFHDHENPNDSGLRGRIIIR
jgi:plastocyanin